MTCHVKSGQVKSSQNWSGQYRSGHFGSSQIKSCWGRSNQVMTGLAKLELVKLDKSNQKIVDPKFVWTNNFFGPKFFFGPKVLDPNFLGTKIILELTLFRTHNFY